MASSPAAAPTTTAPPVTASPPSSSPPAPATTTPTAPAPSPPAPSPPAPVTPSPAAQTAPTPPSSTPSPPSTTTPSPPPPSSSTPSPPSSSTPSPPPPSSSTSPSPPSSTTPSPPPPSSSTKSSPSSSTPPPPSSSSSSTPSSSSSSSSSTPSSTSSSSSSISTGAVVAVGLAGLLAVIVVAILVYCLCCRRKKKYYPPNYYGPPGGLATHAHYKDNYYPPSNRQGWSTSTAGSDVALKPPPVPPSPRNGYDPIPPPPPPPGGPASGIPNSKAWYSYEELEDATGGFARQNMLGEGGFGCVFKGTMSDGQLVAVKQLKAGATQGEREFMAEVEIISRVHHRHLVSLVGYCISDSQRLLVYDYVPNGTLEYHLHKRHVLDWPTRLRIALGAARGLAYLHEDCHPRIIHRDIKSSNILLDDNFEAQVSDFGLAKLSVDTNTHISTRVMGTFGYLAPEYASTGKLTEKSDVFSFGVVLLELLTGRKPVDASQPMGEESLVEWARPVLAQINGEEDLELVADPALDGEYNAREMLRMAEAAAACVRHSANKRPKMGHVVRALEDDSSLSDLNRGLRPGQSSVYGSSLTSAEYDNASTYSAEMRKFRKMAFESQEYGGSEYSGATSEYGINPSASSGEYQMASREMMNRDSREMKPTPSQRARPPLSVRRAGTSSDFTSG